MDSISPPVSNQSDPARSASREKGELPGLLPLVGREDELARLRGLLDDGDGSTSVVLLCGDGGVGKSRLASELARIAEKDGWRVIAGRAYPVETGVPYALFADAFLPTLREMDPATLTVLSRGGESELTSLFPALGAGGVVPASSGDPAELRTRLMWNFAEFTKRLAGRAPLLCVLEDLQWADDSSLELLHFLARQIRGAPIRIVCTENDAERARTSHVARVERSLAALGVAETVRLEPLSLEEVGSVLCRAFGVEAAVVREFAVLLFGWTRGNPFFLREILESMVSSGRLYRERGVWMGWGATDLGIPGTVRDTVLARIGSLSRHAQEVVELAAVVGARARHPVLARLAGLDEDALLAALEELRRHRILEEREEGDSVVYVFAQPLTRQALYEELGLQRARVLHGRVAEVMQELHGARALEHAGELAYHFSRTDLEHHRGKATAYLVAAGRQALDRRADREAAEYLEAALARARGEARAAGSAGIRSALEIGALLARARQRLGDFEGAAELWAEGLAHVAEDGPEFPQLLRALGMAHFWCGRHAEAHAHLDRGLRAAEERGDFEAVVRARVSKGHCLHEVGRGADALETILPALPLAEAIGDPRLLARVHRSLALLYVWIGPPARAHEHGERAVELAREAGEVSIEFWAQWGLAVLVGMRGETARMSEIVERITSLADRVRSPVLRLWTTEMTIELAWGRGDWDAGIALGEQAIDVARDLRQRTLLPRLLVWTSQFHLGRGDVERARALVDEAVDMSGMYDRGGPVDVHQVVPAAIGLAYYRVGVGEYAEAIEAAERGLRIAEGTGYVLWALHRLLPVLAEACLWAGEIDRAAEVGARLRQHAQRLDHKLGLAWADACDALVCWKQGDPAGATSLMRRSAESLEEVPMIPYAVRIRRQLAGRLLEIGEQDAAVAELKRVHEICLHLGAAPELEKTRAMFAEARHPPPPRPTRAALSGLTERETEVAVLTAARLSNEAIGARLGISARTASTHLSNIYKKLGIGSRGELADIVREAGLLER